MDTVVTFYYSIGSRYSYLASTQIDAVVRRHGATLDWVPLDGFELRKQSSSEPFLGKAPSGQYRSPFRENDIADWAQFYGIKYREPPGQGDRLWWHDFDARMLSRAAVAGLSLEYTVEMSRALFGAMFASDIWPVDAATCIECAVAVGIDRDAYLERINDPENEALLTELSQKAAAKGVFGVPSFCIDSKLFFGNDRIVLLDHYLASRADAAS